jgi:hypothetical protein
MYISEKCKWCESVERFMGSIVDSAGLREESE